ncbi:MAG: ATP-binding cassette domain-containing protein, partial [Myxococcales bacterium]|nr:ATP-binding cassette domain-containing protein [Myxococcales bacterium]
MIQLVGVSKSFGSRRLFSDITWRLAPGRRIGLIGPNGAGKTTLFRIIRGE